MAGLHPLPPTHIHTTTRLTHAQAHTFLSSFLSLASTHPEYRPDAHVSQHGISAAGVGDGSNLTISHLERILKGIAGERVGGLEWNTGDARAIKRRRREEDAAERAGGDGEVVKRARTQGEDVVEVEGADGGEEAAVVGEETGEWQDKEDWEHAQADVTEDLEGRDPAGEGIEKRGEEMEVGEQKMSKEERKLAKKERLKKEKQERASQRQQKG